MRRSVTLLGTYLGVESLGWSRDNSVFSLLRNFQTVFQTGSTILLSHRYCLNVGFSTPSPALLLSVIVAITVGVTYGLVVVLTCASPTTSIVFHVLIRHSYLFGEMSIHLQFVNPILIGLFILLLSYESSLFWIQLPYHIWFASAFSPLC